MVVHVQFRTTFKNGGRWWRRGRFQLNKRAPQEAKVKEEPTESKEKQFVPAEPAGCDVVQRLGQIKILKEF